jgi:hypothetical protein
MRLSDKALEEFMAIYAEEFGDAVTHEQASEMAHRVLAFYRLLRRTLPESQLKHANIS